MLMHLLSQIADGGNLSRSELSRRLNISNDLLEQMLLDLSRMGYIESVDDTRATSRCTHCPFSGECASINKGKRWALTHKGVHTIARRREGVTSLDLPFCSWLPDIIGGRFNTSFTLRCLTKGGKGC